MVKPEWGIYPEDVTPKLFWGARAIIRNGELYLPIDRQNFLSKDEEHKEAFVNWINKVLIPYLDIHVAAGDTKRIECHNGDESFHCVAEDRDSGGYLYIGAYSV